SFPVQPGDTISASVTVVSGGRFTLTISDGSNWSYTTTQKLNHASLSSAEVIAEAPSSRGGVLPLANFGNVTFTNVSANLAPLTDFTLDPITMQSGSSVKAQPNKISGGSFSVAWMHS